MRVGCARSPKKKLHNLLMFLHLLLHSAVALVPEPLSRSAIVRTIAAAAPAALAAHSWAALAIPPPDLLAKAPGATPQVKEQVQVLYTPPSVKGLSTPEQIALADHLSKTGAKFYGAYWCTYCNRQRTMFGAGGSRALPYIECAQDGYQAQRCPKDVTGYPSWQIGGKFYSGMQTLSQLQQLSGFDSSVKFPEYVPPPPPPRPPPPPGGFRPPAVETKSTSETLALAKHLQATGAKFYGAYWCKYCGLQRQLFGADALPALPYVECEKDGFQSKTGVCSSKAEVKAYPTWEINGKFYSGMKSIDELKRLSGFASAEAKAGAAADVPLVDFSGAPAAVRVGDDCALSDEDCVR